MNRIHRQLVRIHVRHLRHRRIHLEWDAGRNPSLRVAVRWGPGNRLEGPGEVVR